MPAREICVVDVVMYLNVKVNLGRVEENKILMRFQMKSPFKYFIGPPNPNPKLTHIFKTVIPNCDFLRKLKF